MVVSVNWAPSGKHTLPLCAVPPGPCAKSLLDTRFFVQWWHAGSLVMACEPLVVAQDLAPPPGLKPQTPPLGAQSLSH